MNYLLGLILLVWIGISIDALAGIWKIKKLESEIAIKDGPLISIIVAAKNEEETLRESLETQLQQTYGNLEWILVNDRSTDETGLIMNDIASIHPNTESPSYRTIAPKLAWEKPCPL